jgi:hypothetical protein
MHLFSVASLLLFAAAVGGYAWLFRKRQLQRLQQLHEADVRAGRGADSPRESARRAARAASSRGGYSARVAPPAPRTPWSELLSEWAIYIITQPVWVLFFTVMLVIGVIIPGAGALKLFHHAGLLTQYPLTPASLLEAVRYAVWTAAGLVMLGMLGFRRYGPFLAVFLAGLFACSLIAAILFSSLAIIPVHLVVSPLFGIDAWIEWRPFVHLAFVVLGVPWSFSICWEARRDLLDDRDGASYGGSYRLTGNPGTAAAAGGALLGGLFDGSGSAGGSWSNDSGGGDSD